MPGPKRHFPISLSVNSTTGVTEDAHLQPEPKAGIIHGRQFNTVAKKNLWKFIGAQLNNWARIEYSGSDSNWGPRKWKN
jgi:hypothetical protein